MQLIEQKIQELAQEASELSRVRESLVKQLKDIDIRLTQITGAITELKKMQDSINTPEEKETKQ